MPQCTLDVITHNAPRKAVDSIYNLHRKGEIVSNAFETLLKEVLYCVLLKEVLYCVFTKRSIILCIYILKEVLYCVFVGDPGE